MNPTTDLDLSVRVERLERDARRLRRSLAAALLALVTLPALAFVAVPRADTVRASRIELVDGEHVRGLWRLDDDGNPHLEMFDTQSAERIELGTTEREALFVLRDMDGNNRAGLAVDEYPHFMMHDAGQKPRFHAAIGRTGQATFTFIHKDGTRPLAFGLKEDGTPWSVPEVDGIKK